MVVQTLKYLNHIIKKLFTSSLLFLSANCFSDEDSHNQLFDGFIKQPFYL